MRECCARHTTGEPYVLACEGNEVCARDSDKSSITNWRRVESINPVTTARRFNAAHREIRHANTVMRH